ncbi:DUF2165 domain-containing protein [Leucobacter sp. UT-8R-CII-1-4]|uniref:DUF2165 family protein n=1 Tax=Leucobacter sp. UT-8R-CII-1-4 TaxID=3040075 RepID=UPI0024A9E7A3|nr:DUF2165 domain-containing protein [Leucobacter sp. UT-8R-CII-1-4]MDI6024154.1 DUF2165 domain-containing protein [Leucobacter sp. UT-8R-CII-1-4]
MKHPLRLLQAFTLFSAGLYGLFVFMGNLMDYDSNYQFVKHVLSMDTTFEGNALMWRAITEPWMWTAGYIGIILAEGVFTALGLIGGIKLFLRRNADAATFNKAKSWGYGAYGMGFVIWFIGFIVIGSEWFAMWQSSTWNGKDTAMPLAILWAGFAVLLAMSDPVTENNESN